METIKRNSYMSKTRRKNSNIEVNQQTMTDIVNYICEGKTIKECARKIGVSVVTVYSWMKKIPKFKEAVQEAREIQAQSYIDDLIEIADDNSDDLIVDDNGKQYPNTAAVARSKLKIATRQKIAGYYSPKVFGDKVDLSLGGSNAFIGLVITPPTTTEIESDDKS
jgi:transposase-like protein